VERLLLLLLIVDCKEMLLPAGAPTAATVTAGRSFVDDIYSRGLSADDLARYSAAMVFGGGDPLLANGRGKFNEADRRFLDLREPDGELFPTAIGDNDAGAMFWVLSPSSSSAIANSASVTSALSRLLTGTMVCVECKDSAIDTGRDVLLPTVAAPCRIVLKLMFESLFRQTSFVSAFS
jgi:hypothetical protein